MTEPKKTASLEETSAPSEVHPATESQIHAQIEPVTESTPLDTVFLIVSLLALLYVFLIGVGLIEDSFKLMAGGYVSTLFKSIANPLVGLMIGMCATALLQSSSTTTSIVVGLVAGGGLSVPTAIPIVMGANIGTSVTNTLVSMGHAGNREEFRRAFAGATVHDFFNVLSVAILLPLEVMFGFIQKTSAWMTTLLVGSGGTSFKSPLKMLLKPVIHAVLHVDKGKIKAASLGKPVTGSYLKGGIFQGTGFSDQLIGGVVVFIGALITVLALFSIVKLMKRFMEARAAHYLKLALEKNAYSSLGMGVVATVMVQSSSITTSTLVPLVGVGLVSLEAIFPLTLGANIGTTATALIASLGGSTQAGLQVALCHLIFNIFGILIWFPLPFMRRVPLRMATTLGDWVSEKRWLAIVYIAVVFFLIPLTIILLGRALS